MPDNMPSDEFLKKFEHDQFSAQCVLMAKTYFWQCSKWINSSVEEMENDEDFDNAIRQDQAITEHDTLRCLQNFYNDVNPTLPCKGCGCCGICDVPFTGDNDHVGKQNINIVL